MIACLLFKIPLVEQWMSCWISCQTDISSVTQSVETSGHAPVPGRLRLGYIDYSNYSIDASSPCKTDQSTCTVTSGNHQCIRTTLSDSRLRPAPPLPEGHSNQSHSDTETVRSLASSGSCIERAWVAKNIVSSWVVDRLCMILIGLDLDGINILRPVQVSSHSGPTTRCATRKSSARTLSKIRSVCMALRKINKNIYQSQRNVRIKCISLRCIAKQEIERQVNHVWKLFNVWQNHNMKFQTRTHIHTHTHALRGAHTHGHTYMHRHTYTHTHTLFKKWWHQGTWSLSTFSISSNDLNKDELNTSEHNCRRRHADRLEPLGLRKDAWKAQEVFVVSQETVTVVICCHVVEHCKFYELVAVITRQLS